MTPYTTSPGATRLVTERAWSMLASRLPWVSIAARGAPAVPLVNSSTARWSGVDVDRGQRLGGEQLVEASHRRRRRRRR